MFSFHLPVFLLKHVIGIPHFKLLCLPFTDVCFLHIRGKTPPAKKIKTHFTVILTLLSYSETKPTMSPRHACIQTLTQFLLCSQTSAGHNEAITSFATITECFSFNFFTCAGGVIVPFFKDALRLNKMVYTATSPILANSRCSMNSIYYCNRVYSITMIRLSQNLIKSSLLMNMREEERIIKFCFGGMESQGELMPKLSLHVMKEQKEKGSREVTVVGRGKWNPIY